jgi:transposase
MIYAGVDIAKMDHVASAVDETGETLTKPLPFKNTEAGLERLIAWLEGLAESPEDVFVGMEATGNYWMACFAYLTARGYHACVINPMQVGAVRRLKGMPRVKNDRVDSVLIAETLRIGEFDETRLATDDIQALKTLTRYHQALKQELATIKTQAICLLDAYFPEYASLFSDIFGAGSLAVLAKCPLPAECARSHTPSLAKAISKASHGRLGIDKASELKAAAKSSVGITLGSQAVSFQIKTMVTQVEFLNSTITKVSAEVEALLSMIEPLITTIPGVSVTTGAQIVAEIGDIKKFTGAAAIVKYAGLNPGVSQSGRFEANGEPITKHGSPYLRRSLWLAANRARQYDPSLRAFYDKKRSEGKCHRVAVTAIARKLCHIVFAVMRDQVPYDPDR